VKRKKIEGNIIIAINAMKKIMVLFLGPFLTAYFIKASQESIIDLSVYYIFSYILLAIGSFIVASIIKNKFRIGMFRIGVILNFLYIMSIIILKEEIINHLGLISIFYGISSSSYWFPYNLFVINKIDNSERTDYTVKSKIVSSIIGILCPIILGSIITVTNYELTAVIILFISLIQIILSFILTPEEESDLPKFNLKNTWHKLKDNKQIRRMSLVEFFIGMNVSDGALEVLMTILIFNSFKTNMNLGIITSITTILSMIFVRIYGKIYKNKDDKKMIIVSSILPVISVLILLVWRNNITIIIYNVCYVIFTSLLTLAREIRLFNLSDSYIVDKNNQCEFFAIREGILNCGRILGYLMLLFAGLSGSQIILNIVMVLLTLSILIMGLNIIKIEKFEE
jgi:YQGE family putative transporter